MRLVPPPLLLISFIPTLGGFSRGKKNFLMHAHTPLSPFLLLLVLRALVIINNYYYYYWVTYARIPVCLSAGVCLACGETWWAAGRAGGGGGGGGRTTARFTSGEPG